MPNKHMTISQSNVASCKQVANSAPKSGRDIQTVKKVRGKKETKERGKHELFEGAKKRKINPKQDHGQQGHTQTN